MSTDEQREAIRVLGFWRWLGYRYLYRPISRLLHRFSLHYAPTRKMADGSVVRWCRWCGLRDVMYWDSKRKRLVQTSGQGRG